MKVTIENIDGKNLVLTLPEARRIYNELKDIFDKPKEVFPSIPYNPPYTPWTSPWSTTGKPPWDANKIWY